MQLTDLPALNALLNSACTLFLMAGFIFIRNRKVAAHATCMLIAVTLSAAFLTSYVIYHYHHGSTPFTGQGWIRPAYFAMLITHMILAAALVPLVIVTLVRALKKDFLRHKAIARWTFPIWLYVSVTGVLIYLTLYKLYPTPEPL